MPFDRAVFENVPSIILQPKSAWCVLFGGVWRKPLEILRREGKAHVMGLRHACRSTESLGKRLLFLLDNMALVLGDSKGRGSTPNLSHTCREICVISLATFTIRICRWIASEDNPADEPARSKRYRPNMLFDADQCGPSATWSAPDSELLVVLSAKAVRVASEEAKARKRSRSRSCAGVADQSRGRMETGPKSTRRKRTSTNSSPRCSGKPGLPAPPLRRVVLRGEPSHRSHGSSLHGHAQRVSGLCENDAGRGKVVAKVGRDGGGDAGTLVLSRLRSRSMRLLDGSSQVRRMDLRLFGSSSRRAALKGYRRKAPGMSRGPLLWVNAAAMMGVAMATKDEEFAVMLVVQYVAYLRPSELCNLTAGQVIRPLQGSGASSWALLLAPQEDLKASETAEFDESVLLDGHLSVALGQALMRYTTGKASATPLFSRTQTGYALDFAKWVEVAGVNVITTHPHGGASSDAHWRTRSLLEIQNEADGAARQVSGGTRSTLGC